MHNAAPCSENHRDFWPQRLLCLGTIFFRIVGTKDEREEIVIREL